jgi:hypothetical protein
MRREHGPEAVLHPPRHPTKVSHQTGCFGRTDLLTMKKHVTLPKVVGKYGIGVGGSPRGRLFFLRIKIAKKIAILITFLAALRFWATFLIYK